MIFNQAEFNIRFEWGEMGVASLAPISDAIIIVDVLSFSTAVSIAVSNGAEVYPYRRRDGSEIEYARSIDAHLAGSRGKAQYSLSPDSLKTLPAGARLVLPSPNGATLSLATGGTATFAGCLRNAKAVAHAAMQHGSRVSVVACGERWKEDGSLRPAYEDLLGAGSIIRHMAGSLSPEARAAVSTFQAAEYDLLGLLRQCSSGKELIAMGFEDDIALAAELDVDMSVPFLENCAYRKVAAANGVHDE